MFIESLKPRPMRARAVWLGQWGWWVGHREAPDVPSCIPAQITGLTLHLLQSVGEDRIH